ncbi:MAG: hypothetical protein ACO1RX_03485 [Candidatus Sericytochromatia bacterium]
MRKTIKEYEQEFEQAIASRNLEAVEALIPKLLKKKSKLIFQAIENADVDLVRTLIQSGIPLEERYFGGTPLLTAVFELTEIERLAEYEEKKKNLITIIHLLVEKGANINARAPDGVSVLRLASTLHDQQIPDYIRSMGAE